MQLKYSVLQQWGWPIAELAQGSRLYENPVLSNIVVSEPE